MGFPAIDLKELTQIWDKERLEINAAALPAYIPADIIDAPELEVKAGVEVEQRSSSGSGSFFGKIISQIKEQLRSLASNYIFNEPSQETETIQAALSAEESAATEESSQAPSAKKKSSTENTEEKSDADCYNQVAEEIESKETQLEHLGLTEEEWEELIAWMRANGLGEAADLLENNPSAAAELMDIFSDPTAWLDGLWAEAKNEYDQDEENRNKVLEGMIEKVAEKNGYTWSEQYNAWISPAGYIWDGTASVDENGNVTVTFTARRDISKGCSGGQAAEEYYVGNIHDYAWNRNWDNAPGGHWYKPDGNFDFYGISLSEEEYAYFDSAEKRFEAKFHEALERLGLTAAQLDNLSDEDKEKAAAFLDKMFLRRYEDTGYLYLDPRFYAFQQELMALYDLLSLLAIISLAKINLKKIVHQFVAEVELEQEKFSPAEAVATLRGGAMSKVKYYTYTLRKYEQAQNQRVYMSELLEAKNDAYSQSHEGASSVGNWVLDVVTWGGAQARDRDEQRRLLRRKEELDFEYANFQAWKQERYEEVLGEGIDYNTGDPFGLQIDDLMTDLNLSNLLNMDIGGDKWDIEREEITNEDKTGIRDQIVILQAVRKIWYLLQQAKARLKEAIAAGIFEKDLASEAHWLINGAISDAEQFEERMSGQLINQAQTVAGTHNAWVDTRNAYIEAAKAYANSIWSGQFLIFGGLFRSLADACTLTDTYYRDDESDFNRSDLQIDAEKLLQDIKDARTEMGDRILSADEEAALALDQLEREQWLIIDLLDAEDEDIMIDNGNEIVRISARQTILSSSFIGLGMGQSITPGSTDGPITKGDDDLWSVNQAYVNALREALTNIQNLQKLILMIMQARINLRATVYKLTVRGGGAVEGTMDSEALNSLHSNKLLALEMRKVSLQNKVQEHNKEVTQYRNMVKAWVSVAISAAFAVVAVVLCVVTFGAGALLTIGITAAAASLGSALGKIIMAHIWEVDENRVKDEDFYEEEEDLLIKGNERRASDYLSQLSIDARREIDALTSKENGYGHTSLGDGQWAIDQSLFMDLNKYLSKINVLQNMIVMLDRAQHDIKSSVLAATSGVAAASGHSAVKSAVSAEAKNFQAAMVSKEQMLKDIVSAHNLAVMQDKELTRAWVSFAISIASIAIGAGVGAAAGGTSSAASAGGEAGAEAASAAAEGATSAGSGTSGASSALQGLQYGMSIGGVVNALVNLIWSAVEYSEAGNGLSNNEKIMEAIEDIYKINRSSRLAGLQQKEKDAVSRAAGNLTVGAGGGDIMVNGAAFAALREEIEGIYNIHTLIGTIAQARSAMVKKLAGMLGIAVGGEDSFFLEAINNQRDAALKNLQLLQDRTQTFCERSNQINNYLLNVYMSAAMAVVSVLSFCLTTLPDMAGLPSPLEKLAQKIDGADTAKGLKTESDWFSSLSKTEKELLSFIFGENFDGNISLGDLAGALLKVALSPELSQLMMLEIFKANHDNKETVSTKEAQVSGAKKGKSSGSALNYFEAKAAQQEALTAQIEIAMAQLDKAGSLEAQRNDLILGIVKAFKDGIGMVRNYKAAKPLVKSDRYLPLPELQLDLPTFSVGATVADQFSFSPSLGEAGRAFRLPDIQLDVPSLASRPGTKPSLLGGLQLKLDPALFIFNPFMMELMFDPPARPEVASDQAEVEGSAGTIPSPAREEERPLVPSGRDESRGEIALSAVQQDAGSVARIAAAVVDSRSAEIKAEEGVSPNIKPEQVEALAALIVTAAAYPDQAVQGSARQELGDLLQQHPETVARVLDQADPSVRAQLLTLLAQQLPAEYDLLLQSVDQQSVAIQVEGPAPQIAMADQAVEIPASARLGSEAPVDQTVVRRLAEASLPVRTQLLAQLAEQLPKEDYDRLVEAVNQPVVAQAGGAAATAATPTVQRQPSLDKPQPSTEMHGTSKAALPEVEIALDPQMTKVAASLSDSKVKPSNDDLAAVKIKVLARDAAEASRDLGEENSQQVTAKQTAMVKPLKMMINGLLARIKDPQLKAELQALLKEQLSPRSPQPNSEQLLQAARQVLAAAKASGSGGLAVASLEEAVVSLRIVVVNAQLKEIVEKELLAQLEAGKSPEQVAKAVRRAVADLPPGVEIDSALVAEFVSHNAEAVIALLADKKGQLQKFRDTLVALKEGSASPRTLRLLDQAEQKVALAITGEKGVGGGASSIEAAARLLAHQTDYAASLVVRGESLPVAPLAEQVAHLAGLVLDNKEIPELRQLLDRLRTEDATEQELAVVLEKIVSEGNLSQTALSLVTDRVLPELDRIIQVKAVREETAKFLAELQADPSRLADLLGKSEPVRLAVLRSLGRELPALLTKGGLSWTGEVAGQLSRLYRDSRLSREGRELAQKLWQVADAALTRPATQQAASTVRPAPILPTPDGTAAVAEALNYYSRRVAEKEQERLVEVVLDKAPLSRPERQGVVGAVAGISARREEKKDDDREERREAEVAAPILAGTEYGALERHNGLVREFHKKQEATPLA